MDTKDLDFNNFVTVVAGKEAMDRFNADSIFTYTVPRFVPLTKNSPRVSISEDMSQFEYCTRMYIFSKNGPMLMFVWLFTPEGKENEDSYIRRLDSRVWYDNSGWTKETAFRKEGEYLERIQEYIFSIGSSQ
jgi:hypothetical protein